MIVGVGTDIVEINRMETIQLDRLIQRILTEQEQAYLPTKKEQRLQFVAGRFAAKEAIAKALGTGVGAFFSFQDAEIIPDPKGKPEVKISSALEKRLVDFRPIQIHLSISHSEHVAVAMVVIESLA